VSLPTPQILLVDDDPELRSMLRRTLVRSGYAAHEAGNGREALAILKQVPIDLVVTDIIMPDMEGIELILSLHKHRPALRVIAMSAGGRLHPHGYLTLAKSSGATRTIEKPFEIGDFLALIREVLALPQPAIV
jgi:DNA-binding NtrC family response regulator